MIGILKPLPTVTAGLVTLGLAFTFAQSAEQAQPQRYLEDVKYLASPQLEGRGAGTQGLERASQYIEDRFKQLHLQPAGEKNSFRQALQDDRCQAWSLQPVGSR